MRRPARRIDPRRDLDKSWPIAWQGWAVVGGFIAGVALIGGYLAGWPRVLALVGLTAAVV